MAGLGFSERKSGFWCLHQKRHHSDLRSPSSEEEEEAFGCDGSFSSNR